MLVTWPAVVVTLHTNVGTLHNDNGFAVCLRETCSELIVSTLTQEERRVGLIHWVDSTRSLSLVRILRPSIEIKEFLLKFLSLFIQSQVRVNWKYWHILACIDDILMDCLTGKNCERINQIFARRQDHEIFTKCVWKQQKVMFNCHLVSAEETCLPPPLRRGRRE